MAADPVVTAARAEDRPVAPPRAGRRGGPALWRRALALWRVAAYLDLMFLTRSPQQVLGYLVTDALLALAAASGTLLLAARFSGIGAWSRPQVLFMLGYALLATGLLSVLFGYNVLFISRRLGRGQLDHTLLQPQPLWLALLTEGFMPFSGAAELVPGVVLLVWAMGGMGLTPTPGWLALLLLNLAGSAAVVAGFSYGWGAMAFWAPRAAEEVSSSAMRVMHELKSFPLDGAGALLTGGLLTALPAGFVAWYPCRALLGLDPMPGAVFVTPLAGTAVMALALGIFRRGIHHYARTGSQRYSDFGHRR
jgi:ABC-2 type transport system permease protein